MESFSRNIENQEMKSVNRPDLDEKKYQRYAEENYRHTVEMKKLTDEDEKLRDSQLTELDYKFENTDKKERVSEFIRDNCSEPIGGVEKVVPYQELAKILLEDAQNEVNKSSEEIRRKVFLGKVKSWMNRRKKQQVLDSIKKGNAKDRRIYELPAYQSLIEKGFILPSDVRNYYDSANKEPVYHLGIDYNIQPGTPVASIYDGEVVVSGEDYDEEYKTGFGHKVIIKHKMPDGTEFYSLYGHIGAEGLPAAGDKVKKGQIIGKVGKPFDRDNGNWNAHLHFQIMENVDSPKGYSKYEGEGNYDVLKAFGKK